MSKNVYGLSGFSICPPPSRLQPITPDGPRFESIVPGVTNLIGTESDFIRGLSICLAQVKGSQFAPLSWNNKLIRL